MMRLSIIYLCKADIDIPCQGLYDRKYVELYNDGNAGATTSKKLWLDSRARKECGVFTDDQVEVLTTCSCCEDYSSWKKMHPSDAKMLQNIADMPRYYKVCDKRVNINDATYQGTIRALHMAPKGECTGIACSTWPHPFTCDACEALQHGKAVNLKNFYLFAPFLCEKYPSIAYSCWDHSARTVIRNLMNRDTVITTEVKDKHSDKLKAIECRTMHLFQIYAI